MSDEPSKPQPSHSIYFGHAIRALGYAGISALFAFNVVGQRSTCREQGGQLLKILSTSLVPSTLGVLAFAYFAYVESYWVLVRRYLPDGDLGVPFLGTMVGYMADPIQYLTPWLEKQDLFLVHCFFKPQMFAFTDEEHQWIWAQERKGNVKGFWPDHWTELIGSKVVSTSYGEAHKQLRKWMEPVFLPAAVREYVDVLDATVQKSLQGFAEDGFVSTQRLRKLALRLLFVAIFQQENEERLKQLDTDIDIWFKGFESLLPVNIPGTLFGKAKQARVRLMDNISTLVEEFEALIAKDPSKKDTLLGRLLEATDGSNKEFSLSRDDLYSNLNVLFFAGHDTTYATTSNLVHNLVKYPEAAKALLEEVQTFPSTLSYELFKPTNSPILNAFIDETMRLDPVIGISSKELLVPLERNGYKVPKSFIWTTSLIASSRQVPQPDVFALERHLPADHPYIKSKAFVGGGVHRPFGGGNHVCIGQHFAKLELKILLVRIVQQYHVQIRNVQPRKFPLIYYESEFKLSPKHSEN